MRVTLYSNKEPSVYIQNDAEQCGVLDLERHIRTLQKARTWLIHERKVKRQREAAAKFTEQKK